MSRRPLLYLVRLPVSGLLLLVVGCISNATPRKGLEQEVDAACGGPAWRTRYALAADLVVQHNDGTPDVHATVLYDTRNNRLVMQFPVLHGGVSRCGFDGQSLWLDSPDGTAPAGWPADLQWTAYVAVPYRLTAPTLHVREAQPVSIAGEPYRVAELQRPAEGPGACALYIDPGTLRPRGGVPVCTAGKGETPAYAFAYDGFDRLEDVVLPTHWSVWNWDPITGVQSSGPVATVTLDNPRFVEPAPSLFLPPPHDD